MVGQLSESQIKNVLITFPWRGRWGKEKKKKKKPTSVFIKYIFFSLQKSFYMQHKNVYKKKQHQDNEH